MALRVGNFFADLTDSSGERIETLFEGNAVQIERIVSNHHRSPAGFWYDQAHDEWVMVVRGSATLELEDGQRINLEAGDYLTIPRHLKHRVQRTGAGTLWLAIHVGRKQD